jgi:hypothetical protein
VRIEIDVRPEVARFALLMEQVLRTHDHEYHGRAAWRENSIRNLFNWLMGETEELRLDLANARPGVKCAKECADIANLAMMIADNHNALPELP